MRRELINEINKLNFISYEEKVFEEINEVVERTLELNSNLNFGYKKPDEVRKILSEICGKEIDESVQVLTPFNTDFGANIKIGKDVFINKSCTFVDLGGIDIADKVLIGPDVKILSVNHPLDPGSRRGVELKKVTIEKNVWIGASSVICPGVTVGENSVIAAGSVVTKNVPANSVYAGVPAKFIKAI